MMQKHRLLELGISFWIGVGLMSIINIWKITQSRDAAVYSWIMFIVSVLIIIIGTIILIAGKKKK